MLKKKIAYCCYNKNEEIRIVSSSGGMFYLLSEYVIKKNGVVFGAKFDENFEVIHSYCDTLDKIVEFMGSKYVQSRLGDTYISVRKYLREGRTVLFSGTPCQIQGLASYLGQKYENLILVDFICHGVPSPVVWRKYKAFLTKEKIINKISFRDKEEGWNNYSLCICYGDGKRYRKIWYNDLYLKGFIRNLYLRPSCYDCKCKGEETKISDLTLADFWGGHNEVPDMVNDIGTSAVIINSQKGVVIFNEIKSLITYKEILLNQIVKNNTSYVESAYVNKRRESFFKAVNKNNFSLCVMRVYVSDGIKDLIKKMINVIK